MRRLLPVSNELATVSDENNVVSMAQADVGVMELVKDSMDKLTTTLNRCAPEAANGHVLSPIGQPELPPG